MFPLTVGILATIIAAVINFTTGVETQIRGYTMGAIVAICLIKMTGYPIILGIITIIVGLRKSWAVKFRIFGWLFFSAGLFDIILLIIRKLRTGM